MVKSLNTKEVLEIYNDTIEPTVTLNDTDADDIVANSDVVTITATFSEPMTATPTLNLSGIGSNLLMSSTASKSVWTYSWTVSTSLAQPPPNSIRNGFVRGNPYSGNDGITFILDNAAPTVVLTSDDTDQIVSNSDLVIINATFSEPMTATPTLNLWNWIQFTDVFHGLQSRFGPILGRCQHPLAQLPQQYPEQIFREILILETMVLLLFWTMPLQRLS